MDRVRFSLNWLPKGKYKIPNSRYFEIDRGSPLESALKLLNLMVSDTIALKECDSFHKLKKI
jgi:hypothetical protein